MNGHELGAALAQMLPQIRAVRAPVMRDGISSHWLTDREACVALEKFKENGLTHVEKFHDAGLFAVFAKFPHDADDRSRKLPG